MADVKKDTIAPEEAEELMDQEPADQEVAQEAAEAEEAPDAEETAEGGEAQEQPSVQALEAEIDKLKLELADTTNSLNRSRADFANYRRRVEEQKGVQVAYGKEQIITQLLPVLDNLDLALSHSDTTNMESYKQGVELVIQKLRETLVNEGLEEIKALGEPFNPEFHHGVNLEQNPEIPDQEITNVFQKGYTLNGKVIRPSMVTVNQNS